MKKSLRGALVSTGATALLLLAQSGVDAAGTVTELNTPSYENCPGTFTQSNSAAPPYVWSMSVNCTASVKMTIGGRVAKSTGTVTGSYAPWTTTANTPCPNGSAFTTTITLNYTDRRGSIHFSVPMEVTGSSSSNGTTVQTWCFTQYNLSYSSAQPITATGEYATLNEMCTFELGVETDAPGGQMFFAVNDKGGTAGACAPSA